MALDFSACDFRPLDQKTCRGKHRDCLWVTKKKVSWRASQIEINRLKNESEEMKEKIEFCLIQVPPILQNFLRP